jgi:acyl carrier protein
MALSKEEIIQQLTAIFRDVMDNDDIVLSSATTAYDIEEWDSLTHIQLIVGIEKHFKIRFNSGEIGGFKNVGEVCDAIQSKVNKA